MGTINDTENLGKSIAEIFDRQYKYVIPLYQRNFSWRQPQIEQLLQDIYSAFKNGQNHYYIGSLVVLKRSNGDFEVVDGQQRLTVLSLITKIMKINDEPHLFYDSRPEFEEFLADFYKSKDGNSDIDYPQTAHLRNAIGYIKEIDLDAELTATKIGDAGTDFANYFKNNVILVRVEIPQDTDVASYFEIMNNRGAQLQKHEILKSFLLSKLNGKSHDEFAKIWTACSQMDTPIQKLFTADDRRRYFGDNYDEFCFEGLAGTDVENRKRVFKKLDTILNDNLNGGNDEDKFADDNSETNDDETKYKSIIDFPNFLMHVFKVMFPDKVKFSDGEEKEIPLNEKYLISTHKAVENQLDSEDFIKTLFFCRTIFDKYVVKTIIDNKAEEGERWTLRKSKKNNNNALDYVNTFENDEQNRIVKALTMLQVSFRSRIYKNWLFEILKWFNEKKDINIGYDAYLHHLDSIILDNFYKTLIINEEREIKYNPIEECVHLTKENSYSEGLNTPHFLFNFIDYLYWVDWKSTHLVESSKLVKDFEFKYWDSVEHHLARQFAEDSKIENYEDFIDNLGNLCLISKSSNSRLSDRSVEEKISRVPDNNLGANRRVVYSESKDSDGNYSWKETKIKQHYNEILELLNNRDAILPTTKP